MSRPVSMCWPTAMGSAQFFSSNARHCAQFAGRRVCVCCPTRPSANIFRHGEIVVVGRMLLSHVSAGG